MMEEPGSNSKGNGNDDAVLRMLESIDRRLMDQEVVIGRISQRMEEMGQTVDQVNFHFFYFVTNFLVRVYIMLCRAHHADMNQTCQT
jgi:GH15 family glucan-1,4-alpha-glucosidase